MVLLDNKKRPYTCYNLNTVRGNWKLLGFFRDDECIFEDGVVPYNEAACIPLSAQGPVPLQLPSEVHLSIPSQLPSNFPTSSLCSCSVNDALIEQTIYASAADAYWRIQVFFDGTLEGDLSDPECNNTSAFNSEGILSYFGQVDGDT